MTWGSNPSFDHIPCKYCNKSVIDDEADGPSHFLTCPKRPWWKKLLGWK